MDTESVLAILRDNAAELQAAGIAHVRVFGSVARGEATETSDIDLMADFDGSKTITLVMLGGMQERLRDLLGRKVDLSSATWMRAAVRERATREALVAF